MVWSPAYDIMRGMLHFQFVLGEAIYLIALSVVVCRKGFMEDKYDNLPAALKVMERPTKGEKLHKRNIQCSDGSKYMSYIKVVHITRGQILQKP